MNCWHACRQHCCRSQKADAKSPAKSFTLHDLTVFPLELRAVREREDIGLTPREAALLQMLHDHLGEVVTRDLLLDRCWGASYFPESRTLDQHIVKLRKNIERDAENPQIIETVRGAGCRHRAK